MIARNGEAATRRPSFMGRLPENPMVGPSPFGGRTPPPALSTPPPGTPTPAPLSAADMQKISDEIRERLGQATKSLRHTADHLAAEARSDALEIGFMVARRILEADLTANVEHLVGLVRSAIRRLGESRQIKLHMCPEDARLIDELLKKDGPQEISSAQIEIMADPSLHRGDCVVIGDLGTVDGRINTRLEELRQALQAGTWEETP
jgi:flagellar biosynthesis/type III secretory pathway protein FliH